MPARQLLAGCSAAKTIQSKSCCIAGCGPHVTYPASGQHTRRSWCYTGPLLCQPHQSSQLPASGRVMQPPMHITPETKTLPGTGPGPYVLGDTFLAACQTMPRRSMQLQYGEGCVSNAVASSSAADMQRARWLETTGPAVTATQRTTVQGQSYCNATTTIPTTSIPHLSRPTHAHTTLICHRRQRPASSRWNRIPHRVPLTSGPGHKPALGQHHTSHSSQLTYNTLVALAHHERTSRSHTSCANKMRAHVHGYVRTRTKKHTHTCARETRACMAYR